MPYHFAKYLVNVAKFNVLTKYRVLNERGKFGAKILSHWTDIAIFVLGYFNFAHSVYE